jgi:hypothetical protein
MTSLAETIADVLSAVASNHRVNEDLASLAADIRTSDSVSGAVGRALGELRRRAAALREAELTLRKLTEQLEQKAAGLKFTSEGWRERKPELECLFAKDKDAGLAEWLDDWFTAAASVQLDALDRLTDDLALPDAGRVLADRLRTARQAIGLQNWDQSRLVLEAGVEGLTIGGRSLPASSMRRALRLLSLRIAIGADAGPEAVKTLFDAARADEWTKTLGALADRWHRLGGPDLSDGRVRVPTLDDAKDLDVAVELIYRARNDSAVNVGLDAARAAIREIPFIDEMEARIAALLTDIPQELWIAAAERALGEGDDQAFDRAIEKAKATTGASYAGRATMYELVAAAAERRRLPTADRAEALKQAGKHWIWASNFQSSRGNLKQAVHLDPEDVEAQLSFADVVQMTSWDVPLSQIRGDIEAALQKIENAHDAGLISPNLSWGYGVEGFLRERRSDWNAEDSDEQPWRALIARARCVAGDKDAATRWANLAFSAEGLHMPRIAATFLKRALNAPLKAELRPEEARLRANLGMHRQVLEVLEPDQTSYGAAIRGFSLLRLNEPAKAVDTLKSIQPIAPHWFWARDSLICGLILTNRMEESILHVEKLRADVSNRTGERGFLYFTARCSLYSGDFVAARELAGQSKVSSEEFDLLRGIADLLSGKTQAGVDAIESCFQKTRDLARLSDWLSFEGPLVKRLADIYDVTIPSLDATAEECLAKLQASDDPRCELEALAENARIEPRVVTTAQALVEILLAMATGDMTGAASLVTRSSDLLEASDLEAMKATIEASRDQERRDDATGTSEAATSVGPDEPPATEVARPLELCLPNCWFDGYDDPRRTHELFIRFLPEARLRQPKLPPVKVTAVQEFDPDKYTVALNGHTIGDGRVDPAYLYASRKVVDLIDHPPGEFAYFDADLVRVDREKGLDGLGKLLTMPAPEVVVRLLVTSFSASAAGAMALYRAPGAQSGEQPTILSE